MKLNNIRNKKGITLIALVITILVIIILATVSINLLLGEDGIIKKSKEAKENTELAKKDEEATLNELYSQIEDSLLSDKVVPQVAIIEISGNTTTTSLPATLKAKVTHIDDESGINIEACKYILNKSSDELGTTSSKYTDEGFGSNEEIITLSLTEATNYYLHILSVDNAGNAIETIEGPITVSATYHKHTGNSTNGGGCYTKAIYKTENYTYEAAQGIYDDDGDGNEDCPQCHHQHNGLGENGSTTCKYGCTVTSTGTRTVVSGYETTCEKSTTTIQGYTIKY